MDFVIICLCLSLLGRPVGSDDWLGARPTPTHRVLDH